MGETVQEIADRADRPRRRMDERRLDLLCTVRDQRALRVPASGGQPVALTTLEPRQNDHRAPLILPGGRHFIFYARGEATARGVYVANIDGSEPRRLLDAAAAAVYAPSGHLLFARENQLLAQRFDPATITFSGEPFKVADNVSVNRGVSLATLARFVDRRHCLCHGRVHAAPVCVVRSIGRGSRPGRNTGCEPGTNPHCRRMAARSHSRD